jgi:hypothetical protein
VRLFGVLLLVMAVALAVFYGAGTPLGGVLYRLWPPFLNTLQAGVQRRLAPELWDWVLLPLLEWPAWLLPGVFGLLFVLLSRKRA